MCIDQNRHSNKVSFAVIVGSECLDPNSIQGAEGDARQALQKGCKSCKRSF